MKSKKLKKKIASATSGGLKDAASFVKDSKFNFLNLDLRDLGKLGKSTRKLIRRNPAKTVLALGGLGFALGRATGMGFKGNLFGTTIKKTFKDALKPRTGREGIRDGGESKVGGQRKAA